MSGYDHEEETDTMSKNRDQDAARRLLSSLSDDRGVIESLDNQLPEYVQAELDEKPIHALYPSLHEYILHSEHASVLYASLLELEKAERVGTLVSPPQGFKADLSFLDEDKTRSPLTDWRARVVEAAERLANILSPRVSLSFGGVAEAFFSLRPSLPDNIELGEGIATAFGAADGEIPTEVSWLEAAYQFQRVRLVNPAHDATRQALDAAQNAGLPRAIHTRFAELIVRLAA